MTAGIQPPEKTAEVAFLAIRKLRGARSGTLSADDFESLSNDSAWALVKCLRRDGWWFPDTQLSPHARLRTWLTTDRQRLDFSNGTEQSSTELAADRISAADAAIEGMARSLCFPRNSCLVVLRVVQSILQRMERHEPPLSSRIKRNWPVEVCFKETEGGLQNVTNDPRWLEDSRFNDFCLRFDAQLLDAEFFEVETSLQIPHARLILPELTGHTLNDELYAQRAILRWLEEWRDQLLRESQTRRELPAGWEPNGTR